jgi:hypothetical protein
MEGLEIPTGVGIVLAVIVGVVVALMFFLHLWSEFRVLLEELKEWWDDRRR